MSCLANDTGIPLRAERERGDRPASCNARLASFLAARPLQTSMLKTRGIVMLAQTAD